MEWCVCPERRSGTRRRSCVVFQLPDFPALAIPLSFNSVLFKAGLSMPCTYMFLDMSFHLGSMSLGAGDLLTWIGIPSDQHSLFHQSFIQSMAALRVTF